MPTTYTHYRFGKMVRAALPADIRNTIDDHRELYDIGLHGPDILFYYEALKSNPVSKQGNDLHDRYADEFFARGLAVIDALDSTPTSLVQKGAARAYMYGFICHYALDSVCHPYVEKMIAASGVDHNEIEMELDRYLLVMDGIDPIRHRQTQHIKATEENAAVIAPFFEDLSVQTTKESLRSMIFYHNLFLAPNGIKRRLLYAAMRLAGKYESYHGLVMSTEPNPLCRDFSLLLTTKFNEAIDVAASLITAYAELALESPRTRGELPERFHRTFGAGDNWESLDLSI